MGPKILVLLALSMAFVLLITSEVAARELAETQSTKNTEAVSVDNYGGIPGGHYNNGGGYNQGGGYHQSRGRYNHGGGYNTGGGGYHGGGSGHHCYHGYCHGRCCKNAAEAEAAAQVKPQN